MSISRHGSDSSLCSAEELSNIIGAANKSTSEAALLVRKLLSLIILSVILIKEYERLLKDIKLTEVTLILNDRTSDVGKKRGLDEFLRGRGRSSKSKNSVSRVKYSLHTLVTHPRISEYFLHISLKCKVFFTFSDQIIVELVNCSVERGGDRGSLKVLISVHTGNFFHNVRFNGNVTGRAPGGNGDMHLILGKAYLVTHSTELLCDDLGGDTHTESSIKPIKLNVDLVLLGLREVEILVCGERHLGVKLSKELHGERKSEVASLGVDSLLVSCGCLCSVLVSLSGSANALRVEVRDLKYNAVCRGKNGILRTAHNTCKSNCALSVCDNEIVIRKRKILIVEELKLLSVICTTNTDMVDYVCRIKHVCGLTRRKHNVIGNVNERVNGAHTNSPYSRLHLKGSGLNTKSLKLCTDIARATLSIVNSYVILGNIVCGYVLIELLKRKIVKSRKLARDTVVTPKIGAVSHRLVVYLKNNIVKSERICKRSSGRSGKRCEIHDLVIVFRREKICHTNLNGCTYHTKARNTAKLGVLYFNGLALTVPAHHSAGAGNDYLH